jgi:hypothetical protein
MPTYVIQQDGMHAVGLKSPVAPPLASAIVPQLKLTIDVARTVVLEPNKVGTGAGSGGEIAVVF